MAYKELMRWEGSPNFRWKKMRRGKKYVVTCDALKSPRTREGSRQAANTWWESKLKVILAEENTLIPCCEEDHEKLRQLGILDQKISFAETRMPHLLPNLQRTRKEILHSEDIEPNQHISDSDDEYARLLEGMAALGVTITPDLIPHLKPHVTGSGAKWGERLERQKPVEEKKKVGNFANFFIREAAKKQKPATTKELRKYIALIIKESGIWTENSDISETTSGTVSNFVSWLDAQKYHPATHNKILGFFQRFIRRAYAEELLEILPRNLLLDENREKVVPRLVPTFSDVVAKINKLPAAMRLWSILGLNCGCSNADLGALKWEDFDTNEWRLTRKRVKTETTDGKAPLVTYKIWPETIELLSRLPNRTGIIFVTSTGSPMYKSATVIQEDGSVREISTDLFSSYWYREKNKPDFTVSKLRSIGGTAIEHDPAKRFISKHSILYLGRMPSTIDEKSYLAGSKTFMDEAIDYLHQHLGINNLKMDDLPQTFLPC